MSKPAAYRTTYTLTILSQAPIGDLTLAELAQEMDTGDLVGNWEQTKFEKLDRKQAIAALEAMGSEASFFGLDDEEEDQ